MRKAEDMYIYTRKKRERDSRIFTGTATLYGQIRAFL